MLAIAQQVGRFLNVKNKILYSQKLRRLDQLVAVHAVRKDVLEEVVDVPNHHAHHINDHRVAQDHGEAQQHVRQVGRLKLENAKEVHPDEGVTARPHVHQHDGEGLPQEQQVDKGAEQL